MPSSSRPLILLIHKMHESGMRMLREAGELRMASDSRPATLQAEVVGAEALVIRTGGVIDAPLLDQGKRLKVIGRHGVGYDQIDIEAATARGIQVVYTPGANTQSVSEHVFAFMIGLSKHFPRMTSELARGNYHGPDQPDGAGDRGQDPGHHRLRPDRPPRGRDRPSRFRDEGPLPRHRSRTRRGRAPRGGAKGRAFASSSKSSDYITLHVPLDASTRGMIDRVSARPRCGPAPS